MGVSVQKHITKYGHTTARFHIYDPITKKRTTEKVNDWILYKDDRNRKQKLNLLEQLRRERENDLYEHKKRYNENALASEVFEQLIRGLNISSKQTYKFAVKRFNAYFPDITFKDINSVNFKNFASSLYQDMKVNSANVYIVDLLKLFKSANELGYIREVPKIKKRPRVKSSSKDILLIDEFRKLLSTYYEPVERFDIKIAMKLSFYTGIGLNDARAFRKSININREFYRYGRSKNETPIDIKIYPELIGELPEKFDLPAGNTVRHHIKEWKNLAGINKHITFYSMRHSFAVNSRLAKLDIEILSAYLGHSKITQTVEYLGKFVELRLGSDKVHLPRL